MYEAQGRVLNEDSSASKQGTLLDKSNDCPNIRNNECSVLSLFVRWFEWSITSHFTNRMELKKIIVHDQQVKMLWQKFFKTPVEW